jgi:APA family basic amino acid/polyamine antiporter
MEFKLKRELGLLEVTLCGIGIILGAGIYVLVGKVAGLAGNASWISFLIAAFIASLTGLSYAELSSIFPKAGAEYVYTKAAFGEKIAFLIGWLIILSGIIGGATIALGFASYFSSLFKVSLLPVAILLILGLTFIIFYGIKESAVFAIIFTFIEVLGLFLIIFIGLPFLGSINYLEFSEQGISGVFGGAALIFFAYLGFEEMVKLSEETKKPTKILPKALLLAIAITTLIYVLVSLSAVSVVGWKTLSLSDAPLGTVASAVLGEKGFMFLWIIALFATTNTTLFVLLATSRIIYGMAKEGSLPKIFSTIHPKRRTPHIAILFVAIFAILFVLIGKIEIVASMTNLTVFITFAVINASLIWLRIKAPKLKRPFKVPLNIGKIPVLTLLALFFCSFMIFQFDLSILLFGVFVICLGIVIYTIWKKKII